MSDFPRVCMVGAGNLSSARIYPYLGAAGARLVGVCDLDEAKAARNAALYGGQVYTDLAAMLDVQKPDGVIVCVGPRAHAELARQVLAMGYPVYTEKPPAISAADAYDVVTAARRADRLCMTAFKKRYNAAYTRAAQWLAQYPPADWLTLSIDYCSGAYNNARLERTLLFDFCVHAIDLAGYLFGDAQQVFAFAREQSGYAVSVRFANGAVGTFTFSDGRDFRIPTEEVEITVRGGHFMTVHNSSSWRITQDRKCCEWREPSTFTSGGDSGNDTGHLAELVAFVAALKQGDPRTRSDIYESYKTMVLYEAIRDSAATGQVVTVAYRPDPAVAG